MSADVYTIVTGASSNHFDCLRNLLWTIARHEPRARVLAWDLGLTPDERAELLDVPPFYLANWSLPVFDFAPYPPHFAMAANSGRMGFRPVSVAAAARQFGGAIFWMDAGCQLAGRLDEMMGVLRHKGPYARTTNHTIGAKLSPETFAALGVTADLLDTPLRDAGSCAFNADDPLHMALVMEWERVALNAAITAPAGTTKHTHRQDAVFTVLLTRAARANGWDLMGQACPSVVMRCDNISFAEMKRRWFIPNPKPSPARPPAKPEY